MEKKSMSNWFVKNPDLLLKIENDIENYFQGLRVIKTKNEIIVKGRFDVFNEGVLYDSYLILMKFFDDHPQTSPAIFEIGGRVPHKPDRHIYDDGSACLFVPIEKALYWPDTTDIAQFLGGPVNAYFYGQTYFRKNGVYPFGERSHNFLGFLESIQEQSGVPSLIEVPKVIDLLNRTDLKGHWTCPCGSQKILRKCHWEEIKKMKIIIGKKYLTALANLNEQHKLISAQQRTRELQTLRQLR
jgi:hypothetical protein